MKKEPITVRHFLGGLIQPKTGLKALAFLPWLGLFGFLGWSVYTSYIQPFTKHRIKTEEIVQKAENITNIENNHYDPNDKCAINMKFMWLRIGVCK